MTLLIRQASLADAAWLKESGSSIYRAHFKKMWHSEKEMNDYLQQEYARSTLERSLQDPGAAWFVAETEIPVGFAKITWESRIPGTDISGMLLNKLYLSPAATGKKYGALMFKKFIKLAQARGQQFLWLEVLEQNERAYRFYTMQGMQYIKDVAFSLPGQQSRLKIMGMPVPPGR